MKSYLVCRDYGTGGAWWRITAPSPEAISEKYRDVFVHEEPPRFWTDEDDRETPRLDLSDPPDAVLAELGVEGDALP